MKDQFALYSPPISTQSWALCEAVDTLYFEGQINPLLAVGSTLKALLSKEEQEGVITLACDRKVIFPNSIAKTTIQRSFKDVVFSDDHVSFRVDQVKPYGKLTVPAVDVQVRLHLVDQKNIPLLTHPNLIAFGLNDLVLYFGNPIEVWLKEEDSIIPALNTHSNIAQEATKSPTTAVYVGSATTVAQESKQALNINGFKGAIL